jgi:hypothetical protein
MPHIGGGTAIEPPDSPGSWFRLGLKHAPRQTKFILVGVVAIAAATVVLSSGFGLSVLVPAVLFVLVAGLFAALLSAFVASGGGPLGPFFGWGIVLLFFAVMVLFISSAFFGVPERGTILVGRMLKAPELVGRASAAPNAIRTVAAQTEIGMLPVDTRIPLYETDRYERVSELAKRPGLQIENTRIMMKGNEARVLHLHTLNLRDGGIVTSGGELTLEVVNLHSDNGFIRSFEDVKATNGLPGTGGGHVTLIVHGKFTGVLAADLPGTAGSDGRPGSRGVRGSVGAPGDNAASGAFDCSRGAGRGRPGGKGGRGENGAAGAKAGDGGTLEIVAADPDAVRQHIRFSARAGAGGAGGSGGDGGPGGPGGPGGSPRGFCSGSGPEGDTGPQGERGDDGQPGAVGSEGRVVQRILDDNWQGL